MSVILVVATTGPAFWAPFEDLRTRALPFGVEGASGFGSSHV